MRSLFACLYTNYDVNMFSVPWYKLRTNYDVNNENSKSQISPIVRKKREENIKVDYSIIRSRPLTRQITIYDSRFTSTVQFTIMASAQIINCITCKEPVRPRQQGLQCDGCFRWNHRVCNTGISLEVYRAAVREGAEIEWQCEFCQHSNADTTRFRFFFFSDDRGYLRFRVFIVDIVICTTSPKTC